MNNIIRQPLIIQGGMGIGVSSPKLASEVARYGQLGVVSLTGVAISFLRKLMDKVTHYKEAAQSFFDQSFVSEVMTKYYGKKKNNAYLSIEMPTINPSRFLLKTLVLSAYVEVHLAKKGHDGLVGINMLEKIQMPTLPSLFGAILASVDYVIMGAGIPVKIPEVLAQLSKKEATSLHIKLNDSVEKNYINQTFDPNEYFELTNLTLKKPKFLAVVGSLTLANYLLKAAVKPDGFIIEMPIAGGHNAPPRGSLEFDSDGEPIYGPKDDVDLAGFRKLGVDFWLAGGFGTKEKLKEALDNGARGIQVGSAFAFCDESGFTTSIKQQVINQVLSEKLTVKTDMKASPTGFPFKVLNVTGTLHDETAYLKRKRVCDLGYLREAYEKADGNIGYRCPSEPVDDYVKKGGKVEDTIGRKCLCNGLVSAIGVAQLRNNEKEGSLITAGNDVVNIKKFIKENQVTYSAKDVLDELLCN